MSRSEYRFEARGALHLVEPSKPPTTWRDRSPHYAHCTSGPCSNGTRLCPSPQACRRPDKAEPSLGFTAAPLRFIIRTLAIGLVLFGVLYLARNLGR